MSTQGMVTILVDNEVKMKIVVGCNGYNSEKVAKRIRKLKKVPTLNKAYEVAEELEFGCKDCLVVINSKKERYDGEDKIESLYRSTFNNVEFNPREENGEKPKYFFAVNLKGHHLSTYKLRVK